MLKQNLYGISAQSTSQVSSSNPGQSVHTRILNTVSSNFADPPTQHRRQICEEARILSNLTKIDSYYHHSIYSSTKNLFTSILQFGPREKKIEKNINLIVDSA